MDFAKKTFLSAPANRQLLAQRAMRLVTRIDISTCRCVNIFTVGKPFMKIMYRIVLSKSNYVSNGWHILSFLFL